MNNQKTKDYFIMAIQSALNMAISEHFPHAAICVCTYKF